ncbi:MAG: IMP dehydrogenase [Saprospiraceae bacterium]
MDTIIKKFATLEEALTFDDVLLIPSYSEVLPREVDISTQFTTDIRLKAPIVSAAMDTVTEYKLAIAMARVGGMGFIHKNMSIEAQAYQVRMVKRSESGLILDPITLTEKALVKQALKLMQDNKIGGIPIVDNQHKLKGILTNRDLRFETNMDRPVTEIMTKDKMVTAPAGTNLEQAKSILQQYRIEKLPVVDDTNKLVGLITYKDIINLESYPSSAKDNHGRLMAGAAVGVTGDLFERVDALVHMGVDVICLDTAHGHSKGVIEAIKSVRERYKYLQIIGGNVATSEGAEALADAGVNAVKVGVGPGSICTTRIVAGVGVPQLFAIMSASSGVLKRGIPIIGDGGVKYTGDIAKALAAGANSIMAGSLFAGTEEAPGETILFEGRKFKVYRGMGSLGAMEIGSKDRYFQDVEDDVKKLVPEGIEGRVPYKGSVAEVMVQYIGGLRASMGYCGANNIDMMKEAKMVKITGSGILESHPHNVTITKESPNYSKKS